ncbi:hypothetical protein BC829DRAFT_418563 [Chytridium lagenaria]|nr:hypothetical protein BC829DRAFT_418563 [Chytridium lagenaria]
MRKRPNEEGCEIEGEYKSGIRQLTKGMDEMSKTRNSKRKQDAEEVLTELSEQPFAQASKSQKMTLPTTIPSGSTENKIPLYENKDFAIDDMIKQLVDRMECDPFIVERCERMKTFNDTLKQFIGVVGNGVSPYEITKEIDSLTGHIFNNGSFQVAVVGCDHDGVKTLSATSFVLPVNVLTSTDLVGEKIVTDKVKGPLYRLGVGVKVGMSHEEMTALISSVCRDIRWKKAYMDDFDFRKPFNTDSYMIMRRTYFPGQGRVADEGLPIFRKGDVPYVPIFDNTRRTFDLLDLANNDMMARVEPGDLGFIGVTIGLGKEGIRFLPNWISVFKRGQGPSPSPKKVVRSITTEWPL